jgi:H+/Cl- antiporter ClcA
VPAFVGSIVAFSVFGAIIGFNPIFGRAGGAGFTDPRQLIYYTLIGLACGIVGRLYIAGFYGMTNWFKTWPLPRELRPAVAGVAVGCLALALPGVLGTGYGWVQAGFDRNTLLSLPLWVILALPFAKILATSLSIGSGGSGGIFGPGMYRGVARGGYLAAPGTDRSWSSDRSFAICHRRDDGALRQHGPSPARGDADGRRDDRQPRHARPGDAGHRPCHSDRRRSLHLLIATAEPL